MVQIFFPKKNKTAKYAGNWDPHSKQPWSYKLQRWILQNTFLTRNMTVLVYGEWPTMSSNCRSFFTATYRDSDKKLTGILLQNKDLLKKFTHICNLLNNSGREVAIFLNS